MDTMDERVGSISPLPSLNYRAQMAMAIIGTLSLVTTSALWLHITYRLLRWKRTNLTSSNENTKTKNEPSEEVDLSLGISEDYYRHIKGPTTTLQSSSTPFPVLENTKTRDQSCAPTNRKLLSSSSPSPNPLLILIYNLIFADICLAATFACQIVYLSQDGIIVGTSTCNAQGWIVSFGCLTTSAFLCTIAVYTYLAIVRGYKPPNHVIILNSVLIWLVAIVVNCIGLMFNNPGDYYGRQQLWCWISERHSLWRLSIYVWGFTTMFATCILYGVVFWTLWREKRSSRFMPRTGSIQRSEDSMSINAPLRLEPSGHHPAFLIYPFMYMFCATPLTIGSIIIPLERSTPFMAFTGGMLAASGLLDAILWSATIAFSRDEDIVDTGLDQFAFMRTPEGRNFGNMVWVQGGAYDVEQQPGKVKDRDLPKGKGGWWSLGGDRGPSQEVLREELDVGGNDGNGIHMDVITTVVVENDGLVNERQWEPAGKKSLFVEI